MDGIVRTEIDLPAEMAEAAAREGIDLAHLLQETLRRELRRRRMEQAASETAEGWTERHRPEVDSYAEHLRIQGGPFGDDHRTF